MKNSLWDNYDNVFLMSGTIIDPHMFCEVNGIPVEDVAFLRLGSPFPKQNRPIYYYPQGKMTYKNKLEVWDDFVFAINKLLKKYKGKKGIIHCGNYELWEWLRRDIDDDRLIFAGQTDRQQKLDEHLNSTTDTVIVSPSMKQGVDLKDDKSRFQIILKMPYPSLASKVNKKRFETNPKWYPWMTVMDIIQSYGRSIRSETDYADTIILDQCFTDIMVQQEAMLPKYFKEVIKKIK
jgi:Rad3-related DNA helicase